MKRLMAIALVCMLLGSSCLAATWPEGRSPAQPYSGTREVDLSKTIGYIILTPRANRPASIFCDTLQMFLPRDDVEIGKGTVSLLEYAEDKKGKPAPVEVCSLSIEDGVNAQVRPLIEAEMNSLMWGSGVAVEIRLPRSLDFGEHNYFIRMEEGCVTAAGGKLPNPIIAKPEAWAPVFEGEYGIGDLHYYEAPEAPAEPEPEEEPEAEEAPEAEEVAAEEEAGEDGEEAEVSGEFGFGDSFEVNADGEVDTGDAPEETAPAEEAEPVEEAEPAEEEEPEDVVCKDTPAEGDRVSFNLRLGGEAAIAVVTSENGSVECTQQEYTESGRVRGTVLKDDVKWGVVFLRQDGTKLYYVDLSR